MQIIIKSCICIRVFFNILVMALFPPLYYGYLVQSVHNWSAKPFVNSFPFRLTLRRRRKKQKKREKERKNTKNDGDKWTSKELLIVWIVYNKNHTYSNTKARNAQIMKNKKIFLSLFEFWTQVNKSARKSTENLDDFRSLKFEKRM